MRRALVLGVLAACGESGGTTEPPVGMPPLEMLGQQQSVRSTLDDAVEAAYQSAIVSRKPPERAGPAPFIRLTVPDPFEHRQLIPVRIEQAAERLPGN